eukprot:SAG25_NODE_14914_length_199_cov_84.110000_1_plen_46_part_10
MFWLLLIDAVNLSQSGPQFLLRLNDFVAGHWLLAAGILLRLNSLNW